ncbi:TlpA family protein disulfide reductase [Sphingomonas phyllosphaerae]|uniref:TlpA family protein disulfide reductase n=1 Tax=Sphingomonas phyllosphaerae TaxID=257003 RepID=UPI002413589C|nr:TlpA disulfide reductase family protein [Sphingomonas phyllosphaerae]
MVSRVAIVCLLGAALAVSACDKGSGSGGQAAPADNAVATASADEVPATGAARPDKVERSHKGERAPAAGFTTLTGAPTTLTALGGGKPLLVNLWATWCAPCVKEMPTLDAAAGALAGKVRVVAVSQDMEPGKAKDFLKARGFAKLEPFLDEKLALSTAYGANLPTTILYDATGKEIWRVTGDLDWTGAQAKALLAEAG